MRLALLEAEPCVYARAKGEVGRESNNDAMEWEDAETVEAAF